MARAAPKSDVWMAFYVGTYLANTLHLARQHHGSYLMLILAAFKNGGWLPNDDNELAIIAKCTPDEWRLERSKYEAFFETTPERWTHVRVEVELEKAARLTEARRIAGRASAATRQQTRNTRSINDQQKCRPSESQTDSSSHGETIGGAPRASASPDGPPRTGLTSREDWQKRIELWLKDGTWSPRYGLRPDSAGTNPIIPADLLRWAKAQAAQQRSGADS
ncbi:MAG: DUF1376 domain-containing protein [Hyphomonadaceae bacterium]|nr:DUF1376 domain-containing protein [Hyphomonadaceae bacterium]